MPKTKPKPPKQAKQKPVVNNQKTLSPYWGLLVILVLTIIAYLPSLPNDFTNWDDTQYVTDSHLIKNLTTDNIREIITTPVVYNYHPLTIFTLALNYQVSGLAPFSYHLVNLLLHLLNTFWVFYLFFMISKHNQWVSLTIAMLFALHPMHVESVAWVSGRKDVLYTFFMLPALICYIKYLQTHHKKALFYTAALVLFVLSLLSKPSAVIFPLLLLLLDYWYKRSAKTPKLWLEKIPFFALSLVVGLITIQAQGDAVVTNQYHFWQSALFACYGLVAYIGKLFIPLSLSAFYPYPITEAAETMPFIYYLMPLFVLAMLGAAWYVLKRYKSKVFVFGFLFYIINLILVLQFVTVGSAIIAERYTYLSYLGLFFILAAGLYHFIQQKPALKMPLSVTMAVVALGSTFLTHQQTKVWANSASLWTNVIKNFPDAHGAYNNRGEYYLEVKKYDKALVDFNKSIELKPNYEDPYNNRGNLYRQNNQFEKALENYNKAIELEPDAVKYNNRGNAYFNLGKNDLAIADYNKSLTYDGDYDKAFGNRGAAYFKKGQQELALQDFTKAIQLNPDYDDAYLNRGVIHSIAKRFDLAKKDYDVFLTNNPTNHLAMSWRGIANQELKQAQAAIADFTTAINLQNKQPEYYFRRAQVYLAIGDKTKAKADATKAQQLGATLPEAFLKQVGN